MWPLVRPLRSALALPAHAQSVADFYKGKNIKRSRSLPVPAAATISTPASLARHMGKAHPWQSDLVPQNMPGAGGLRVAQYYYQAAPKDGSPSAPSRAWPKSRRCSIQAQTYDSSQAHLAWRDHRRGQRLRHLAHFAGENVEGLARKADHTRRHRAQRRARHLHQPLQERVRRQDQARVAAIRAPPRSCSRSSAASSTASAASTGPRIKAQRHALDP